MEYLLRNLQSEDLHLIHNSWTKAVYEVSPTNFIPAALFYPNQTNHINHCLNHYETIILHLPDHPEEIIGYLNYTFFGSTLIINWLYIKDMFRKRHQGNSLVPSLLDLIYPDWPHKSIVITQYGRYYKPLAKQYKLLFDPYFIVDRMRPEGPITSIPFNLAPEPSQNKPLDLETLSQNRFVEEKRPDLAIADPKAVKTKPITPEEWIAYYEAKNQSRLNDLA